MSIPLEDNAWDILQKAQCGLGISVEELLRLSGVSLQDWNGIAAGNGHESALLALAAVLGLRGEPLVAIARGRWHPRPQSTDGLAMFNTPFGGMTVNAYLFWDPATRDAALVDTGSDADPILGFLKEHGLRLQMILLTHSHGDHIFELDRIRERTGAAAWISELEPIEGACGFAYGKEFTLGRLQVQTRHTSGHSPGGTTYCVHGLEKPLAFVGDALFAGSMGGAKSSYTEALQNNLERIYSLPQETILCPGHGPLTTVGEERQHNPFYLPS